MSTKTIGVIGSGSWGTTIANLIAKNIKNNNKNYEEIVYMWTYEEIVDGRKLTEIINSKSENTKYLPGIKLENVVAIPDLEKVARMSDILVFVVPHQFIKKTVSSIKDQLKIDAVGVSLIKGILYEDKNFITISKFIEDELNIPCGVLMGANIASEVAEGHVAEGTLGYRDPEIKNVMMDIFNGFSYRVTCTEDINGVELAGTLKNIVSIAYGIAKGKGYSENTSVAILRKGLNEMKTFISEFFDGNPITLFESSGIADLIVSCLKGRNYKCGFELGRGKSVEDIENEMNGQKLQGPGTAKEVYDFLVSKGKEKDYPLFTFVYLICHEKLFSESILETLQ
ncbi:Glycerol-3-phosphate dehydrogenase [NAD(+)], cytoplasmic [Dictyocoela muelleri]|nr:Glycerol-3-phosphate dehydrogenase [NAD(+)], cytoplasmic [Dictyocoela muelleri]